MRHTDKLNLRLYDENDLMKVTGEEDSLNNNFEIIDDALGDLEGIGEEIIITRPTEPTEKTRLIFGETSEEYEFAEMSDLAPKTEKHLLQFDGSNIKENGTTLTFDQIHSMLMESPDFVVCVYEDRAYHPNVVKDSQIVFISSFVSSGYEQMDRITILPNGTVTTTFGKSENVANKTDAITESNKNSDIKYPSVKAVSELVDSLGVPELSNEVNTQKESLTKIEEAQGGVKWIVEDGMLYAEYEEG